MCRCSGNGGPQACLPTAHGVALEWALAAHLHQLALKTLARGQASRGGRRKTSYGATWSGRLTRSGGIKAGQTSRGSRDVSHDDRHQAGASARSVLVSSLVQRGQAQPWSTEASGKGYHFGATRPRPGGLQDEGHRGAHHQHLWQAKTPFVRISCTSSPFKLAIVGSLPAQYLGRGPGPI